MRATFWPSVPEDLAIHEQCLVGRHRAHQEATLGPGVSERAPCATTGSSSSIVLNRLRRSSAAQSMRPQGIARMSTTSASVVLRASEATACSPAARPSSTRFVGRRVRRPWLARSRVQISRRGLGGDLVCASEFLQSSGRVVSLSATRRFSVRPHSDLSSSILQSPATLASHGTERPSISARHLPGMRTVPSASGSGSDLALVAS